MVVKGRVVLSERAPPPQKIVILQEIPQFVGVGERATAVDDDGICLRDVVVFAVNDECRIAADNGKAKSPEMMINPGDVIPPVVIFHPGSTLKLTNTLPFTIAAIVNSFDGDIRADVKGFESSSVVLKDKQRFPSRVDFLGADWLTGSVFVTDTESAAITDDKGKFAFKVRSDKPVKIALWHRRCARIREISWSKTPGFDITEGYVEGKSTEKEIDLKDLVVALKVIHK